MKGAIETVCGLAILAIIKGYTDASLLQVAAVLLLIGGISMSSYLQGVDNKERQGKWDKTVEASHEA